jgi:hypothetical protein
MAMRGVSPVFERIARSLILKKVVTVGGLSRPVKTFFTAGPPLVDFFRQARQILQTQPAETVLMIWRLPSAVDNEVFVLPAFKVAPTKFFMLVGDGVFLILEPNVFIVQQLEFPLPRSGDPVAVDVYETIFENFMNYGDDDPLRIRSLTGDIQAGNFLAPFREEVVVVESVGDLEVFLEALGSVSEAVYEENKMLLEVWPFDR